MKGLYGKMPKDAKNNISKGTSWEIFEYEINEKENNLKRDMVGLIEDVRSEMNSEVDRNT